MVGKLFGKANRKVNELGPRGLKRGEGKDLKMAVEPGRSGRQEMRANKYLKFQDDDDERRLDG